MRLNQKRADIIWSRDVELLAVECELIASANSLLTCSRALKICMCDFHRVLVVPKRKEDQMNWSVSDSRGFLLNRRSYLLSKCDFLFENVLQPGSLTSVNLHLFVSERERRSFTSHFTRGLAALPRVHRAAAGDCARNGLSDGTFAPVSASIVFLVLLFPLSRSVSCLPHSSIYLFFFLEPASTICKLVLFICEKMNRSS